MHTQLSASRAGCAHSYLAAVCVLAAVGHAEDACARMPQLRVQFVLKLAPVYTLTTPACARGVTTLDHEVPDDAVELQQTGWQQLRDDVHTANAPFCCSVAEICSSCACPARLARTTAADDQVCYQLLTATAVTQYGLLLPATHMLTTLDISHLSLLLDAALPSMLLLFPLRLHLLTFTPS